jgi:hypothetical protein
MKRRIILSALVAILIVSGNSFAVLYEDFEDGDLTSNPTWVLDNRCW